MEQKSYATVWPRVRGLRICTRISIDEPARNHSVVLVHGLGVSATYTLPTLELLGPYYAAFAPELPGFGNSDRPRQTLNISELADILRGWMDAMGLPRAAFVANSMGCQAVIDLAARYPELVDRAILIGPTVDRRARAVVKQLWRGFRDIIPEPWALYPILARDYWHSGTKRIFKTLGFALQDPVEHKCSLVKAPVLLVRGDRDTIVPAAWIEELATALPHSRLATIENAAHAAHYSATERIASLTRQFLDG